MRSRSRPDSKFLHYAKVILFSYFDNTSLSLIGECAAFVLFCFCFRLWPEDWGLTLLRNDHAAPQVHYCKRSRDLLPQMVCCATGTIEPSYLHILSRLVPILLRWEIVAPFPYKNRLLCTVCLSDCVRLCAILYLCVLLSFTCPPTICNCQKYTVLPGGRKLG